MLVHKMPLAMASPGEEVRVVGIRAGWGLKQRLADLGLTPGTIVKVINRQGAGPVVINFRGSRLALGFGVSQKVMVEKTGG